MVAAWVATPGRAQEVSAQSVVAGRTHTCALGVDGRVLCWGANGSGQLGDGSFSARRTAVPVSGLAGLTVTALVAGGDHTCVAFGGGVRCWGRNNVGQLGDGSTTTRNQPVAVQGLAGLNIIGLAAGHSHTCAVASNGSLRCWGWNGWGQLGDGGTADQHVAVLVALPGLTVTAVAAGYGHSCALLNTGGLRCWGMNNSGQLGDGSNSQSSTPVTVSGMSGLVANAIAAGSMHGCAAFADGRVRCWGANTEGQLGDGSTSNRNAPVEASGLMGVTPVQVTAGEAHTCTRLSNGQLRCWGLNDQGRLGDGTTLRRLSATAVVGLDGQVVTTVAAGMRHTCARLQDSGLRCWGDNGQGQVGDGSVAERDHPVRVAGLGGLLTSTVAAGYWHTCALFSNAGPRCWGSNHYGQLGDGTTTDRFSPTPVAGLGALTVTAIAGSESHACAVISDGSVRCWGKNNRGQLGNGTTTNSTAPVVVGGLGGLSVTAVAVGSAHSCARVSDGSVRCWGQNLDGQLGDGTTTQQAAPVLVQGLAGVNVTAVVAGGGHTCARSGDGAMRCWGDNGAGQLGDGTNLRRLTPTLVAGLSGQAVAAPIAGYLHSCARLQSGALRCWGENSSGQLGDGTTTNRNAPVAVLGLTGMLVADAGAGELHSCARIVDGRVYCWGDNDYGQLGDGGRIDRYQASQSVELGGVAASQLSVGGLHSCVRLPDTSLRCWGENNEGRLGNGEASYYPTPRAVIDRLFGDAFETW